MPYMESSHAYYELVEMATFSMGVVAELERLNPTKVTKTDRVIGKGSYGRVSEVSVHGTLCVAKEIHSILVDNVSPQEFERTKESVSY